MGGEYESLQTLARSPTRLRLLRRLLDGPGTVAELSAEFDAHRRTIKRNLDSLVRQGWVTPLDRKFIVTPAGRLFADDLFVTLERLEVAARFVPFFRSAPRSTIEFPADELLQASITIRDGNEPFAPLQRTTEIVPEASTIQSLAPVSSSLYVDAYVERMLSGARVEMVLAVDVAAALVERYPGRIAVALEYEDVDLHIYDGELPLGIVLTDTQVLVETHDEGTSTAVVESTSPGVRDWAKSNYERYLQDAQPIIEEFEDRLPNPAEVDESTFPVEPTM